MFERFRELIRERLHNRNLARWEKAARQADRVDSSKLRLLRAKARQLRRRVDLVTHIADARLTAPRIGSNAMHKPAQAEWCFRPDLWRGPVNPVGIAAVETRARIGTSVTLHHDCTISELTLRQVRNTRDEDLAPFGLRMDVFKFDGSFLSLVLDFPEDAVHGLRRNHILRLDAKIEAEKNLEIFARLNIKYGPNVEQIVRELPLTSSDIMNEILLRDMTFSRRQRAAF